MKKLLLIVAVLAFLAMPMASFAGISGSDHDVRTLAFDGTNPMSADLCTSCHLPHNATAGADKLWSITVGGTGAIGDLCKTCHDGTIVVAGALTVYGGNSVHVNADGTDATDAATCSGTDGTSCHDVHNQYGTTAQGKFLDLGGVLLTTQNVCAACHSGDGANWSKGDYSGTDRNHPQSNGTAGVNQASTVTCDDCHMATTVHGAATTLPVTQSGSVETNGVGTWLLKADNNATGNWGGVCVSCHSSTGPYAGDHGGSGGSGVVTALYVEDGAAPTTARHTTTGKSHAGTHSSMTGCNSCHYMHDPTGNGDTDINEFTQINDNTESAACITCHTTGASTAPIVGGNSHPILANADYVTAVPPVAGFPASNAIDDDDNAAGNDYGSSNAYLTCEGCHSVHRHGTAGASFLRAANTAANEICASCHVAN